jgi:hypothetical protein
MTPRPRRRLWLPLFLALLAGAGAWWGVGEWLRPRPVWSKQLENVDASIHYGQILLSPEGNGHQLSLPYRYLAIEDGHVLCELSKNDEHELTVLPEKKTLPRETDRYSIIVDDKSILFDTHTGKQYLFHPVEPGEDAEFVHVDNDLPVMYAVFFRPLPLGLSAQLLLPCGASPCELVGHVMMACKSTSCPTWARLVTVPDKQVVSQFMVPAFNQWLHFQSSPGGSRVLAERLINPGYSTRIYGVWNVLTKSWSPHRFSREDCIQVQLLYDDYLLTGTDDNGNEPHALWHVPSGIRLSHGDIVDVGMPRFSIIRIPGGIQWICFVESNPFASCELHEHHAIKGINTTSANIPINSYRTRSLIQGPQSVLYSDKQEKLPEWSNRVLPVAWRAWLLDKLHPQQLHIYDWRTQRLHHFARNAFAVNCRNGEYLLVRHKSNDEAGRRRTSLLEVYCAPLTLFSPWWGRGCGLLLGLTVFLLRYRRRVHSIA